MKQLILRLASIYLLSLTSSHALSTPLKSTPTQRPRALIVGGGPIGFATALILANQPHGYDVKVIESSPQLVQFDIGKAFLYNVNPRGQEFTKSFDGVHRRLVERGVAQDSWRAAGFLVVPGDPEEPLPKDKTLSVNVAPERKKGDWTSYWIPRHEMVEVLVEAVDEYQSNRDDSTGDIRVYSGMECVSVKPGADEDCMVVTAKDVSTGQEISFESALVVGADGWKSKVRDYLAEDKKSFANWAIDHSKFIVKKWVSAATGLRIKILKMPPRFPIPDNDGTFRTSNSETIYGIRSLYDKPRKYVFLGLLPMKNNDAIRTANIITRPNHEIWGITTGPELKQWFETNFPRWPFDDLVSDEEWDRLAKEPGTRFPHCQYCPGMQISSQNRGVALAGDAVHAFPPDIGQGINAGFGDVMALDRALKESQGDLCEGLKLYEKERAPEIKALIRLARFGSPYQYKQPLRIDRFCRLLWLSNVTLRLLLNKISFGLIPTACIMLSQNPSLSYRQVMRRADAVTAGLTAAVACFLYLALKRFFPVAL